MEDGELKSSDKFVLPNSNNRESALGDALLDELFKTTRTCTHTHTCNPPGPTAAHTHICYHTHTQLIQNEEEEHNSNQHAASKSRKPLGNREAVRKYREKKKAHTAYLEEEVRKLHILNQQLLRKLQGQAVLEAEVLRLRTLLEDFRGAIDTELGLFPFQKFSSSNSFKDGDCNAQCETDLPCFPNTGSSSLTGNEKMVGWNGTCEPPCHENL